jgi:hypothetical protein
VFYIVWDDTTSTALSRSRLIPSFGVGVWGTDLPVLALCASIPSGHHTTNTHRLLPARRTLLRTAWKCRVRRSVRATRSKVVSVRGASACRAARALCDQPYHGGWTASSARLNLDLRPLNILLFIAGRTRRCAASAPPSAPPREPQPQIHDVEHRGIRVDPAVHLGAVDAAVRTIDVSCTRAPTHPCGLADAPPPHVLTTNW